VHYLYVIAVEHLEWILWASTLIAGAAPDALAVIQRRRGGGFGRGFRPRRRRRRGGLFGALGALALFLILGPVVILLLVAYAFYATVSRRRR